MKIKILCILVIFITIGLAIIPATANPFDYSNVTDSAPYFDEYVPSTTSSDWGDYYVDGLYFNDIAAVGQFNGIVGFTNQYQSTCTAGAASYSILNKPVNNYSWEPIELYDSITNTRVGSAKLLYQLGNYNDLQVSLLINSGSWNIGSLSGGRTLNLSYTDISPWIIRHCKGNVPNAPFWQTGNTTGSTNIFFTIKSGTNRHYFNQGRTVQYTVLMFVNWDRQDGIDYDTWQFLRAFPVSGTKTESFINLSYWINDKYHPAYTETSINDTELIYVPHGRNIELNITNPVNNHVYLNYWVFETITGNCTTGDQITINTWDGSNGAQLGGTTISLINTTNYIGNISVLAPNGTYLFCLPPGYNYDVGASKTGFEGVNTTWISSTHIGDQIDFWLYPVTNDTFNGTATFIVNDVYGLPISNVKIVSSNNDTRYTNNQGYTQFIVNRTATYSYTASKSGYLSKTVDVTLGGATSKITEIRLTAGVIPTATTPVTTVVTPTLPPGTGEAATQEVSSIFFNAAGAIAILTVLAILLGLVDIMGGQRRRRR